MSEFEELRLRETGWLSWDEVLRVLDGWTCTWVDLLGPHVEAVPAVAPVATHLWGWAPDGRRLVRARLDEGDAVLAFLEAAGDDIGDPVPVRRGRATTWDSGHLDAGTLAGRVWEVLDVLDDHTTTFVRLAEEE